MFCRNCGAAMQPNQAVCLTCGTAAGEGNAFCPNCGQPVAPSAAVCVSCGVALQQQPQTGSKSKIAAGLLAIFLGQLGIHNFYLGYTKKAVIQLLITLLLSWTFVAPTVVWIWAIVEAVKIFQGKLPDANGMALSD